jgi:hypothetical protein
MPSTWYDNFIILDLIAQIISGKTTKSDTTLSQLKSIILCGKNMNKKILCKRLLDY